MLDITRSEDVLWTPVHCRPRCEKVVATYCEARNIVHYLPLRRRAKRYQRRTVETFLPMFPGYLFAQLNDDLRSIARQSNRVAAILPIDRPMEERLIEELRAIQRLEELSKTEDLIVQPDLVPGKPVLITKGPLRGTHGIVQQRRRRTRVTVNVEILGQSVSTDLDVEEVAIDEG